MIKGRCTWCGRFTKGRSLCPKHHRAFLRKLEKITPRLIAWYHTRDISIEALEKIVEEQEKKLIIDAQDKAREWLRKRGM